jgi:hypothetical protein
MSSMKFCSRLVTSHHGPPHPFKGAGLYANSLKRPFVVNRSCIHKGFQVSPQLKMQRIQNWRAWRSRNGPSSTCPSVMIGVTENISHSTAKMCQNTIMHVQYYCKYNTKYIFLET